MTSVSPVNGKPSSLPIVVGHDAVNGAVRTATGTDHNPKSSVTITAAAAATGYMPNGGPVGGTSGRPSVQFGSHNPNSPAASYSLPHQSSQPSSSNLSVAASSNPRLTSPQNSPSPIPQPPVSGGRPPAGLQGQANSLNFGSLGGESGDGFRSMRSSNPQAQLAPAPQPSHLRRESSQSTHSEMSNSSMHNGPGRGGGGYAVHGGRGRGYHAHNAHNAPFTHQQHQPMGYPQGPSLRAVPNQPRGGHNFPQQQQYHHQIQQSHLRHYPETSHRGSRSPAPLPSTPHMPPLPVANGQIPQSAYGTFVPNMGAAQVNSSPSVRPIQVNQSQMHLHNSHGPSDHPSFLPAPNLSPESGFYEQYLMMKKLQAPFGVPQQFDPAYGPIPQQIMYHQPMFMGPAAPNSPRPSYQNVGVGPPSVQPHYLHQNQYGHNQAQPMSRTSSAVSEQRPSSSMGQVPTPSVAPAIPSAQQANQGKVSPVPANSFKIPTRSGHGIVIKDPNSGAVKHFEGIRNQTPPAPVSGSPVIVSSTTTPPPRTGDAQHARSDSKTAKTVEERKNDMKDAIAKKIEAEERRLKEEEERRTSEREQEEAQRLAQEKAEAERAEKEAAEKLQREKEEAEREQAKQEAEEKAKREAEEQARREAEETAKREAEAKAQKEAEETAKREAEAKAQKEAEEERLRKEQEKEAQAKKKQDEEASLVQPQTEEEAEELEAERLRKLAKTEEEQSRREAEPESLQRTEQKVPENLDGISAEAAKPSLGSGASTPSTEGKMGPPPKPSTIGKQSPRPPALNLAPLKTNVVEPAQPSAAMMSLRSARFIDRLSDITYPQSIKSPNPALNSAGKRAGIHYDREFLMQFQQVFDEKPTMDWEHKLKDTVGGTGDSARPQTARTPSLGPRNPSIRASIPSFPMGNFGQGGRTLPPGTTSDQRFNATLQRPPMNNPLAQFARQGGFPMGGGAPPLIRTNSQASLQQPQNTVPQSPRAPSRSQRKDSQRRNYEKGPTKAEEHAAKSMPLTSGLDVKPLLPSSSGWKPKSIAAATSAVGAAGPPPGAGGHMDPDLVQRKVKAALNKMTPEKFDKISDQILDIAAQSKNESDGRTLRQVIQLTFEKATDEAHWASMYARFCRRMLESMSAEIKDESITDKQGNVVTGGNLFRKYLLNRCQEEFERGWKINLPAKPEGESEEAVMLSDEYYIAAAAKRRGLGLVQFIGELYKLGMLTERIMHECVKKLVDYEGVPDEAEVESLTKLLRTIGVHLEQTEKGKALMDVYFGRIQGMIDTPDLQSRLQFMLMDVVDLRKANWASKEDNKGPQTIQEIREKAQREQAEKEEKSRQQRHGGGGGGGRMPMGRGDARSFSGGGYYGGMPPPDANKNTVGMDELRKLGKQAGSRQGQANQGQMSFGPTSMFSARNTSGRKTLGPGASVRGGEESGTSSRTGTPPAPKEKESSTSANAFGLLAGLDASGEPADSVSPSSPGSSPPNAKAKMAGIEDRSRPNLSKSDKGKDKAQEDGAPQTTGSS